jgi:antitoxin (DNA-binding transcriptional repressor) of toxin-antitoxin stability system
MAIVKMRDLLRKPTTVFEELERSGEPALLTRDGKAVAALFPVDSDQAYEVAMAALPEFVGSRERAKHARSEGRTASAAKFLQDFEARHGAAGGGVPPTTPLTAPPVGGEAPVASSTEGEAGLVEELKAFFGEEVSRELASELEQRIAAASEPIIEAAPKLDEQHGEIHDFPRRVEQLNSELFARLLPGELRRAALDVLARQTPTDLRSHASEEGVLGRALAKRTLDALTERVKSFNCELIEDRPKGSVFSLYNYESCVHARAVEGFDLSPWARLQRRSVR